MTSIVQPGRGQDSLDLRTRRTPNAKSKTTANAAGSVAIVVRKVLRDPEGIIGRVMGHLLIEAGVTTRRASICVVAVDQSGKTTVVESHGRSELVPVSNGRLAERLDFAIDVHRRMTPAFETPLGQRRWEVRATVGNRLMAVHHVVDVPAVRRIVRVSADPWPEPELMNWGRVIPPPLRSADHAFAPSTYPTGRAYVRSRGDWGIVDVPRHGDHRWQASILQYEQFHEAATGGQLDSGQRRELVYTRALDAGPTTLEFELPAAIAPSHNGPLLTTWYELRVHTDDGRRLGARHRVEVLN